MNRFVRLMMLIAAVGQLLVAIGFLCAFLWAMKKGQYEDDYTPSVRILFEDEFTEKNQSNKK